jgi:hypothetical protein
VYLNNEDILREVESQISLWLELVDRKEHNGYKVFPYGIRINDGELQSYEINPNQNLAIARLFSNLYFEPKSLYFKSDLFKDIVLNEVNAALSLQDENGALKLREGLPLVYDSNYGGLASTMLYDIVQMWPFDKWIIPLKKIGTWLYRDFPIERPWNVEEDFPDWRQDRFTSYNLISRLLSFYVAGVETKYVQKWVVFIHKTFPDVNLRLEARWMEMLSFPRAYYLEKEVEFYLKPKVYISSDEQHLFINIIGEKIGGYKVYLNELELDIDENNLTFSNVTNNYTIVYSSYDKQYSHKETITSDSNKLIIINVIDKDNKIKPLFETE